MAMSAKRHADARHQSTSARSNWCCQLFGNGKMMSLLQTILILLSVCSVTVDALSSANPIVTLCADTSLETSVDHVVSSGPLSAISRVARYTTYLSRNCDYKGTVAISSNPHDVLTNAVVYIIDAKITDRLTINLQLGANSFVNIISAQPITSSAPQPALVLLGSLQFGAEMKIDSSDLGVVTSSQEISHCSNIAILSSKLVRLTFDSTASLTTSSSLVVRSSSVSGVASDLPHAVTFFGPISDSLVEISDSTLIGSNGALLFDGKGIDAESDRSSRQGRNNVFNISGNTMSAQTASGIYPQTSVLGFYPSQPLTDPSKSHLRMETLLIVAANKFASPGGSTADTPLVYCYSYGALVAFDVSNSGSGGRLTFIIGEASSSNTAVGPQIFLRSFTSMKSIDVQYIAPVANPTFIFEGCQTQMLAIRNDYAVKNGTFLVTGGSISSSLTLGGSGPLQDGSRTAVELSAEVPTLQLLYSRIEASVLIISGGGARNGITLGFPILNGAAVMMRNIQIGGKGFVCSGDISGASSVAVDKCTIVSTDHAIALSSKVNGLSSVTFVGNTLTCASDVAKYSFSITGAVSSGDIVVANNNALKGGFWCTSPVTTSDTTVAITGNTFNPSHANSNYIFYVPAWGHEARLIHSDTNKYTGGRPFYFSLANSLGTTRVQSIDIYLHLANSNIGDFTFKGMPSTVHNDYLDSVVAVVSTTTAAMLFELPYTMKLNILVRLCTTASLRLVPTQSRDTDFQHDRTKVSNGVTVSGSFIDKTSIIFDGLTTDLAKQLKFDVASSCTRTSSCLIALWNTVMKGKSILVVFSGTIGPYTHIDIYRSTLQTDEGGAWNTVEFAKSQPSGTSSLAIIESTLTCRDSIIFQDDAFSLYMPESPMTGGVELFASYFDGDGIKTKWTASSMAYFRAFNNRIEQSKYEGSAQKHSTAVQACNYCDGFGCGNVGGGSMSGPRDLGCSAVTVERCGLDSSYSKPIVNTAKNSKTPGSCMVLPAIDARVTAKAAIARLPTVTASGTTYTHAQVTSGAYTVAITTSACTERRHRLNALKPLFANVSPPSAAAQMFSTVTTCAAAERTGGAPMFPTRFTQPGAEMLQVCAMYEHHTTTTTLSLQPTASAPLTPSGIVNATSTVRFTLSVTEPLTATRGHAVTQSIVAQHTQSSSKSHHLSRSVYAIKPTLSVAIPKTVTLPLETTTTTTTTTTSATSDGTTAATSPTEGSATTHSSTAYTTHPSTTDTSDSDDTSSATSPQVPTTSEATHETATTGSTGTSTGAPTTTTETAVDPTTPHTEATGESDTTTTTTTTTHPHPSATSTTGDDGTSSGDDHQQNTSQASGSTTFPSTTHQPPATPTAVPTPEPSAGENCTRLDEDHLSNLTAANLTAYTDDFILNISSNAALLSLSFCSGVVGLHGSGGRFPKNFATPLPTSWTVPIVFTRLSSSSSSSGDTSETLLNTTALVQWSGSSKACLNISLRIGIWDVNLLEGGANATIVAADPTHFGFCPIGSGDGDHQYGYHSRFAASTLAMLHVLHPSLRPHAAAEDDGMRAPKQYNTTAFVGIGFALFDAQSVPVISHSRCAAAQQQARFRATALTAPAAFWADPDEEGGAAGAVIGTVAVIAVVGAVFFAAGLVRALVVSSAGRSEEGPWELTKRSVALFRGGLLVLVVLALHPGAAFVSIRLLSESGGIDVRGSSNTHSTNTAAGALGTLLLVAAVIVGVPLAARLFVTSAWYSLRADANAATIRKARLDLSGGAGMVTKAHFLNGDRRQITKTEATLEESDKGDGCLRILQVRLTQIVFFLVCPTGLHRTRPVGDCLAPLVRVRLPHLWVWALLPFASSLWNAVVLGAPSLSTTAATCQGLLWASVVFHVTITLVTAIARPYTTRAQNVMSAASPLLTAVALAVTATAATAAGDNGSQMSEANNGSDIVRVNASIISGHITALEAVLVIHLCLTAARVAFELWLLFFRAGNFGRAVASCARDEHSWRRVGPGDSVAMVIVNDEGDDSSDGSDSSRQVSNSSITSAASDSSSSFSSAVTINANNGNGGASGRKVAKADVGIKNSKKNVPQVNINFDDAYGVNVSAEGHEAMLLSDPPMLSEAAQMLLTALPEDEQTLLTSRKLPRHMRRGLHSEGRDGASVVSGDTPARGGGGLFGRLVGGNSSGNAPNGNRARSDTAAGLLAEDSFSDFVESANDPAILTGHTAATEMRAPTGYIPPNVLPSRRGSAGLSGSPARRSVASSHDSFDDLSSEDDDGNNNHAVHSEKRTGEGPMPPNRDMSVESFSSASDFRDNKRSASELSGLGLGGTHSGSFSSDGSFDV